MRTYVSEWDYDFFSGFQILNIFWLETWAGFFFPATPLDDDPVLVLSNSKFQIGFIRLLAVRTSFLRAVPTSSWVS